MAIASGSLALIPLTLGAQRAQLLVEFRPTIWFADEGHIRQALVGKSGHRVAGSEKQFQSRAQAPRLAGQFDAVHVARHDDVREENVDGLLASQDAERSSSVGRRKDVVSQALKDLFGDLPYVGLVFDDQHDAERIANRLAQA